MGDEDARCAEKAHTDQKDAPILCTPRYVQHQQCQYYAQQRRDQRDQDMGKRIVKDGLVERGFQFKISSANGPAANSASQR